MAAETPAAKPEAKPAEAKPAEAKPAPKKKERKESPVYKFFQVKQDKVERLRKECPRCGRGVFLGEHKDRLTCGKCGYTSFKKQK
ncbi:MAG: 30S ribosomal protein S27ae [Nitrososphaerales archaeon]